jgi:hypothetical protein
MLRTLSPRAQDIALNVIIGIVGVLLILSPTLLEFAELPWASWSARLIGAAITLIATKSLIGDAEEGDFVQMALGIWAAISPAMLSFTQAAEAALAHLFLGGAATSLAALKLWLRENRPLSTT